MLDSLKNNKILAGIPYVIIGEIFKDYPKDVKKIQVTCIGCRQKLLESEGANRKFTDPFREIFMDSYKTKDGYLDLWYQKPDFAITTISQRDTFIVFYNNKKYSSPINYLLSWDKLVLKDSLGGLPSNTLFYAEVHYVDNPVRKVSYWYSVKILQNGRTVVLRDLQYEIYPIEKLEFNNQPVTSFKWRN